MTEIWSGTIDACLDTSLAVGQLYAAYVLSGTGRIEEPQQEDANAQLPGTGAVVSAVEDESSFRERIIIRDRDCIPLPHIGMWVQVAVDKDTKTRAGVKTYIVARLIAARALGVLSRTVFARCICNGIAQCKARHERIQAKANNRPTLLIKDVPIGNEATKYIGSMTERPYNEMSVLLSSKMQRRRGVSVEPKPRK